MAIVVMGEHTLRVDVWHVYSHAVTLVVHAVEDKEIGFSGL